LTEGGGLSTGSTALIGALTAPAASGLVLGGSAAITLANDAVSGVQQFSIEATGSDLAIADVHIKSGHDPPLTVHIGQNSHGSRPVAVTALTIRLGGFLATVSGSLRLSDDGATGSLTITSLSSHSSLGTPAVAGASLELTSSADGPSEWVVELASGT